ncbi:hypothetical protein [Cupriavidus sp. IK-TO18]|uniref:hypothetical protein n=1 Tax=Cupriavidus sp. IK-TO18 TaxID=2782182 RepID=UPI00189B4326|nr:hypothetical protein [Cupriavidus sp. IK-TO18]MBF6992513.1 hypothetical protein [Cupriavidus sp. IK-TO18]
MKMGITTAGLSGTGTADGEARAEALLAEAVSLVSRIGVDAASTQFCTIPMYNSGEMYVAVYSKECRILAYARDVSLVGLDCTEFADLDGKFFVREITKLTEGGVVNARLSWPIGEVRVSALVAGVENVYVAVIRRTDLGVTGS